MKKYIFLILLSCIYFSNKSIAQVETLRVVQQEQLDPVLGKSVMDSEGNIIGYENNLKKEGRFLGTYQSNINVEGWSEITIDRYLNLIVDKKNNRIITYGYPPANDSPSFELNFAIYDNSGQLLFQKDKILFNIKNPILVSKKGEIYFGGWNAQLEQLVQKYDKNGTLEWEAKLPFQLMVSEMALSENNLSLAVLQNENGTGLKKSSDTRSALIHLDVNGKVKNSWKGSNDFYTLKFLNNTDILLSNGYHLILKDIDNFESNNDYQFTTDQVLKIKSLSNNNSIVLLTEANKLIHYQIQEKKLVRQKKFDLSNIAVGSLDVNLIEIEEGNTIKISTKNTKYSLQ